jgi:hypothetical protein
MLKRNESHALQKKGVLDNSGFIFSGERIAFFNLSLKLSYKSSSLIAIMYFFCSISLILF